MSLHPNRAELICHESVMMCLFPHQGVYIFQEDITVYLQVKSALKWEFQGIFTFQMVELISEALRPISVLTSQVSIYFHRLKIILLTPGSKTRRLLEHYNHSSYGNLSRRRRLQTECKGCHENSLFSCFGFSFTFQKYGNKILSSRNYFQKYFLLRNPCVCLFFFSKGQRMDDNPQLPPSPFPP